jgi:hypothetical protein
MAPVQLLFDFDVSDITDTTRKNLAALPDIPRPKIEPDKPIAGFRPGSQTAGEDFSFEPLIDGDVADYSHFPPDRMYIASEKTILSAERPRWVPPFDYQFIESNCHIPPVCKINENYIVKSGVNNPLYYKLSLDGFAAAVDYYVKYGKAFNKRKDEEKELLLSKLKEEAHKNLKNNLLVPGSPEYLYQKSIISGYRNLKSAPIRLLSVKRMTYRQENFFKENGIRGDAVWDAWQEIRTDLKQKLIDMSCQYDDLESSYTKGVETSYGDKNTNTALLREFGILIKRQNGDVINRKETGEIRDAFNKIMPVFGNLRTLCAEYGLKVSHSGVKNMHAHRFIGVFYNAYRAIGVKFGDLTNNHVVLAHELSHFLDSRAGKTVDHFFSSDKPGSIENRIAVLFRKEMNQRTGTTINSKYLQRTCECFARAIEQFSAFAVSPAQYLSFCNREAYAPDNSFRKSVIPLIEELITERQGFWHKGEPVMKNDPELFKSLELRADKETADYPPTMNIGEMDDDFLEKMARLAGNRCEWYQQTIDRYKAMETLPGNTLEMLKESRRVDQVSSALKQEYQERLKSPDSVLFPVYPAENTPENFRGNIIKFKKSGVFPGNPHLAAMLLIKKMDESHRQSVNDMLKALGCTNPDSTERIINSWFLTENKVPRKKIPVEITR